ncbi:MAG TPA: aspartate aminotransferase family protein [Galbitalea sp.]|nr:aspartate aminotransferase family protein [Galbitalea sp.]
MSELAAEPEAILDRLRELREADAPTHGGRVLSYVYDSGMSELDELAASAIRLMQPVNGLDPTTFTSVAVLERETVGFVRELLSGDNEVVGSVTSGGTESCLLAVKTARDNWRARGGVGEPVLLAPTTAHAAFRKAAHYFDLRFEAVHVDPETGAPAADWLIQRMSPAVALVVVSAPSYPFAALDPIVEVAAACLGLGIDCHVDACIGGLVLPFWRDVAPWDFAVPGVTSMSADLHKFGYAPKGSSVLLHRGRDRQRAQYFATTEWPGYPIVNPMMPGSRSAGSLAAAWAIIQALGTDGFARLAQSCERSTAALVDVVGGIEGLKAVGQPVGPLFAVTSDHSVADGRRVDPHLWADQVREHGWQLQLQPSIVQPDGSRLPRTTHLTITPVTEGVLGDLSEALVLAADEVRGVPGISPSAAASALPALDRALDSDASAALLAGMGLADGGIPGRMAPLLALVEALPAPVAERLLIELLARLVEP